MAHEWILPSEGQTLAQLAAAQVALGNTVVFTDDDNERLLVNVPSGGSGLANALVYKGATDCSGNPNYPVADAGDMYIVSVAGKIGGASGVTVEAGDSFICKTDGTLAGTQAQRGTAWNVMQGNITSMAASAVTNTPAGNIAATTVQAAIDELDAEKAALSPAVNAQVGTTYTLVVGDNGKIVTLDNGAGITVTVPAGLGAGFNCVCIQKGAGQVTFVADTATLTNRQSQLKIAGQWGVVSLIAPVADALVLSGDTAA